MEKVELVLIERTGSRDRDADMLRETNRFLLKAQFERAADAVREIALLSPRVILLDTDRDDEDMIAAIRNLLLRSPGSELLCLCRNWNEERQNDYLGAGAKSVLVRPFSGEDILKALRSGEEAAKLVDGEVIAFFSPKGKSGRSTLLANTALALARQSGETVAVIDADVEFGDMAVFFNLEPETTIVEAVRDIKHLSPLTLDTYFTLVNDRVKVLCGTRRPELSEQVRGPEFGELLRLARSFYRYVLVDLPQGFNPISVTAAEAADRICLVTMISGAYEMTHLRRSLEVFHSLDDYKRRVKVVFTRVPEPDEATRRKLSEEIGYPVAGMLPNAYVLVSSAANSGRMASDVDVSSPLARGIDELIRKHLLHRGESA